MSICQHTATISSVAGPSNLLIQPRYVARDPAPTEYCLFECHPTREVISCYYLYKIHLYTAITQCKSAVTVDGHKCNTDLHLWELLSPLLYAHFPSIALCRPHLRPPSVPTHICDHGPWQYLSRQCPTESQNWEWRTPPPTEQHMRQ